MKKIAFFLPITSLLLISLVGCNASQEEAKNVAREFIKAKYEVDDYENVPDIFEKVKTYLTSDEQNRFQVTREASLAPEVAKRLKLNIGIKSVSLTESKNEKDKVLYDYEATIILKDKNGKEVYSIQKDGQIELIQQDNQWLIDNEWSDMKEIPDTPYKL